jgi:Arc/MetJ-type ribon-helix-helix transcriptional regulator
MKRLNLHVTPEFERDLRQYMERHNIARRSDAIRAALREAVAQGSDAQEYDYRAWLGMGLKAPLNKRRRFRSEDDLWFARESHTKFSQRKDSSLLSNRRES